MTTNKQSLANRENARSSSGPITETGKEIVSRNSTKHGLLTKKWLILEDENQLNFDILRESIYLKYKPKEEFEIEICDRIASCMWRLNRIYKLEHSA